MNLRSSTPGLVAPLPPSASTATFDDAVSLSSAAVAAASDKKPLYEAESPDELALVDAAYAYNVKLIKRTPYQAVVSTPSEWRFFEKA